jgi:hypothetical protein
MPHISWVTLSVNESQRQHLLALQAEFCKACNVISPVASQNRCWNRVTLHHLTYRLLREQFPALGAQMACNAIYAVCRAYRLLHQLPNAPWSGSGVVPQIRFVESAPVYFDRHTLTLKPGLLSLFSMEGRLRFQLQLDQPFTERFARLRLREVMLLCREGQFGLQFSFLEEGETEVRESAEDLPEYLLVLDPQLQPGAAAIEAVVNMSPSGI